MPALSGEIISTITDGTGAPVFVVYEFFDATTRAMRDVTQATSTGNKRGALIVDNMTGRSQQIIVTNETGAVRTFNIPPSGSVLTAAQLAALAPPNGPVNTITDLSGLSPSLT